MSNVFPWLLVVGLVGGGGWYLHRLQSQLDAEADARTAAEESELRALGEIVEERVSREQAERRADDLAGKVPELQAALDKARKALPRSRIVSVVRASTGPIVVEEPPDEEPPPEDESEEVPCLVRPGDRLELRADEVVIGGRAGARVLVGAISAWRLGPPEAALLARGAFEAPYSEAVVVPDPSPTWQWWHVAAASGAGLLLGMAAGIVVAR